MGIAVIVSSSHAEKIAAINKSGTAIKANRGMTRVSPLANRWVYVITLDVPISDSIFLDHVLALAA